MTDISTIRARVRKELHDEDAANYRWVDAVLDRHVGRAVGELSLSLPLESVATLTTTAGSRDISIATVTNRVAIEAVEYPTGKYPPEYVRFSVWGDTLTLLVDSAPSSGESVKLYYGKLHNLDATSSTLPTAIEELLATGAAAYAAIEWASYATNRVNVGGEDVWRQYLAWGREHLAQFQSGLARHSKKNRARAAHLYRPALPRKGQTTDWGP